MEIDAAKRKATPVYSGFLAYFPDAIAEVARLSMDGNEQHNPGSPLHWDRSKSGDELDSLARHLLDNAKAESIVHLAAVAWRAMAQLQKAIEWEREYNARVANGEDEVRGHTMQSWREKQNSKTQKIAPSFFCVCSTIGPKSEVGHWHETYCPMAARFDA